MGDFITACSNAINVYARKGAYHLSADFAHWYGWAHFQLSRIEIKEEARGGVLGTATALLGGVMEVSFGWEVWEEGSNKGIELNKI